MKPFINMEPFEINDTTTKNEELLMIDSTLGDGPAEHVMDYIISYTLRSVNNPNMPVFASYCRKILFKLIDIQDVGQEISNIQVWKQWRHTDLTAEFQIKDKYKTTTHALLIENKYYSCVSYKHGYYQTDLYKKAMLEFYANKTVELHFALITCIARRSDLFKMYDCVLPAGFKVFSIYDFIEDNQKDCESDIFNQFWLRSWS